jgi:ABC-type multidrug transport system fused ATPase/permease subunit
MPGKLIVIILAAAVAVSAAAQAPSTTTAATATAATATTSTVVTDTDSRETRDEFNSTLRRYPSEVSRVLKLDPSLMSNQAYLANYPALAAFLAQHPEVAHSPSYYLGSVWTEEQRGENSSERVWRSTMEGMSIFAVLALVTGVLTWLVRTVIDHRRWSRVSKVQADVHNKLMDRFTSNEELLAYIQTPAGKRFLESAPIALDGGTRAVAAPVGRILWSVQVGLVLAAAGFGLEYVSNNIQKDVAAPLFAMGVLAIAIGGGFVLSAVVSFILSRKLGLWEPPPPAAVDSLAAAE